MSVFSHFGRSHHHHGNPRCHLPCHRILCGVLSFFAIFGIIIFLVWIILRPSKPEFILHDVAVYSLNISSSPTDTVSVTMQIAVSSRNHNSRIGIYYRNFDVFASFRGEQITLSTSLFLTYQGHSDITVWSPFLYGQSEPLTPELAATLREDISVQSVLFDVKINGKIKWKVGTWTSNSYNLNVNCPVFINSGDLNTTGITPGRVLKFHFSQSCNVEV